MSTAAINGSRTSEAAEAIPSASTEYDPAKLAWRKSASRSLRESWAAPRPAEFARSVLAQPLFRAARRASGKPAGHGVPRLQRALWSRFAWEATPRSRRLAACLAAGAPPSGKQRLSRKSRQRHVAAISELLEEFRAGPAPDPFELLAWLHLLLYSGELRDKLLFAVWGAAWEWSQPIWRDQVETHGLTDDQKLVAAGELPWMCGHVFSELRGARRVARHGAKTLRNELAAGCDEDGAPRAALLSRLPLWLAPLTRAATVGRLVEGGWWHRPQRALFGRVVVRAAALCGSAGETALSNGVVAGSGSLLHAAAREARLPDNHPARLLLTQLIRAADLSRAPGDPPRSKPSSPHRALDPPQLRNLFSTRRRYRPSSQSDASRLICLRNNWGIGADACVIAFDGANPRIDLRAFGVPVLRGDWRQSIAIAGRTHVLADDWECVCWFSDRDSDYVELQPKASGPTTLLRQMFLSRADHFLLLCDIVRAAGPEDHGATRTPEMLRHTLRLPLAGGATSIEQDALTREWVVRFGRLPLRVLPLGLEQETVHRASGALDIREDAITLEQSAAGRGLVCPLLLDWSPARRKRPVQWRSLTVAENGRVMRHDESRGVRWRIGDEQWLYYHALTPRCTARTVLGVHTFHETVIGEFAGSGELDQLVQVESDEDE